MRKIQVVVYGERKTAYYFYCLTTAVKSNTLFCCLTTADVCHSTSLLVVEKFETLILKLCGVKEASEARLSRDDVLPKFHHISHSFASNERMILIVQFLVAI